MGVERFTSRGSRLFKIQISFARFSGKYFAAKLCYGDWKVLANSVIYRGWALLVKDRNVYFLRPRLLGL